MKSNYGELYLRKFSKSINATVRVVEGDNLKNMDFSIIIYK